VAHLLSLDAVQADRKDYFMILRSYYQAIRTATPDKLEAIDMGRRGIHGRGLAHAAGATEGRCGSISTPRGGLFTADCDVLHWKGAKTHDPEKCAAVRTRSA